MTNRVLILGSRGFIGANLSDDLARDFTLCDDSGVDVTSANSVHDCFKQNRPDVVVLAAGLADIDRCEREPGRAEAVNVTGAMHVARECAFAKIRLFFLSTGAVFDGRRSGYTENDPVSPVSVYGSTKARAESIIMGLLPDSIILRLALVLGRARRLGTNSLVDRLEARFAAGESVRVPGDEIRNPIDTLSLSRFLRALLSKPEAYGIFHVGSSDSVSRYELVKEIARRMGYPGSLAIPQTGEVEGRAPRGREQFLSPSKLAEVCGIPAPGWREVAERCIHATAESAV